MKRKQIVIIGASAAGVSAAEAIVEAGRAASGATLLIGAEDRLPYKRTKVCKRFAAGFEPDAFALHPPTWYAEHGVELALGRTVTALDLAAHTLRLDDGAEVGWERLVLATGAAPNRLRLADDVGAAVQQAHLIGAAEALRAAAAGVRTALVVGTGVLGVEVAEQLVQLGLGVTQLGDTPGLMPGELNEPARARLAALLQANGVRLRHGACVSRVERAGPGAGLRVVLEGGAALTADLVVPCVGMRPETALARAAGLQVERGVLVDARLRASHPDVFAAGDVAQHPDGRITHLWRHALQQGRVAGLNAAGGAEAYAFVPFRLKCEVFGDYVFSLGVPPPAQLADHEVIEHARGARYLCGYYRGGHLAGLVMCGDKANQKAYGRAVVEGWDRATFERAFL